MEGLARVQFEQKSTRSLSDLMSDARSRFDKVYEFCNGDLSKDIYAELIHNENNTRPIQINALFKVSDVKDVCTKISDKDHILTHFGETEPGKAHGKLIIEIEGFFERRNEIAHALGAGRSSGREQIRRDIDLCEAIGRSLCETLDLAAPSPGVPVVAAPNQEGFVSSVLQRLGL